MYRIDYSRVSSELSFVSEEDELGQCKIKENQGAMKLQFDGFE